MEQQQSGMSKLDLLDNINLNQVNKSSDIVSSKLKQFNNDYNVQGNKVDKLSTLVSSSTRSLSQNALASTNVALKMNVRGKIMIVTYSVVVLMLAFLLIYNIFAMNQVQNNIVIKTQQVETLQKEVDSLQSALNGLDNQDNITKRVEDLGYTVYGGKVLDYNGINISEGEIIKYESETNWFDAICDFISSVFGG